MTHRRHADSVYRRLFFSESDLAISRAQSINRCASGLSVRFLRVTRWTHWRVVGRRTGSFLIEGYLLGMLTALSGTTVRNRPVAAKLIIKLMAWI
jgi:hypothetical protein